MIGNDVVDLVAAETESNWQRKGFLQKMFSLDEQQIILSSDNPKIMVWVLWSMKESAYKIVNRNTGLRAYIPHLLHSGDINTEGQDIIGQVSYHNNIYFTKTTKCDNALHTVAVSNLKYVDNIKEIANATVVKDERGLPYMIENGLRIPVSKSHHGRFTKVVFIGNN